jgi:predicted alpha/beta hydrolase family esterase
VTKEQMAQGFLQCRQLTQEEWAHPNEIRWVDELIAEGRATATAWVYGEGFQCEYRKVKGIGV